MISATVHLLKERFKHFLKSVEKYTKTDMLYLVKSGFWSLLNQLIGSGSSFVVVVLLANLLPKELFGQYRFVLSIISILTIFTLPGIGTSIVRSIARQQFISLPTIIKTKIKWGFWGSLVSLLIAGYYSFNNIQLSSVFVVTAVFIPFVEAFYVYLAYYKGKQDFKTASNYDSISRLFQALVLIVTALITSNIVILIVAFFSGQLISRFFFYKRTLKDISQQGVLDNSNEVNFSNDTINYGKHISLTNIVGILQGNLDKLLIWHFLGAEILAVYYVAISIPNNLGLLFNVIPRVALPKFSKNNWLEGEKNKVIRKLVLFFGILSIPTILYVLCAPFIIPFLFKTYHASISPALILATLVMISPVNAIIEQVLYAQKSIKKIFMVQAIGLVVFTIVFMGLYKTLGVNGAAIALVSSSLSALVSGAVLIRYTKNKTNA